MANDYAAKVLVGGEKAGEKVEGAFFRPPFGYYGAKVRLAKRIVSMLPPHNAWVEAFCGSAAVTLTKAPAAIEVINDCDGEIVNLFKQLRDRSKELCRLVALTPYSRSEFLESRNGLGQGDELERARRFLVAAMMTINGVAGSNSSGFSFTDSYSRAGKEARVSRWYNLPARLSAVVERLRKIRIEEKDALELIPSYLNRPATLLYLDPPYYADREHSYSNDAREASFHQELLDLVRAADCMVLISGYHSPLYTRTLTKKSGWTSVSIEATTRSTNGKDISRTEILWMNEAFATARREGEIAVKLTKAESKQFKLNPKRSRKK